MVQEGFRRILKAAGKKFGSIVTMLLSRLGQLVKLPVRMSPIDNEDQEESDQDIRLVVDRHECFVAEYT